MYGPVAELVLVLADPRFSGERRSPGSIFYSIKKSQPEVKTKTSKKVPLTYLDLCLKMVKMRSPASVNLREGVHPQLFVKLVFEIVVDRQTWTRDQTFDGSRTPTAHQCPRCSHAHIWSIFGPIMTNHPNMPKTEIMGVLLVASGQILNFARQILEFGRQIFWRSKSKIGY